MRVYRSVGAADCVGWVVKNNCNWWAWREFAEGRANVLILRRTKYSRWTRWSRERWWKTFVRPVGVAIGYPLWYLIQIAWVMVYGAWAHVTTGTHEFVPNSPKVKRYLPPAWYEGHVEQLDFPCDDKTL